MIRAEVLDALLAAGATAEMIVAAVKADACHEEERRAHRREKDAERQRRWRAERHAPSRVTECDNGDERDETPSPDKAPQTPKINPTPPGGGAPAREGRAVRSGFAAPDGVTAEQWTSFLGQRKKKLTPRAYSLLCAKLVRFADAGWPPGEMIDLAIERGWETVFEPKDHRNGQRSHTVRPEFDLGNPLVRAGVAREARFARDEGGAV